jgi:hypothetical protein
MTNKEAAAGDTDVANAVDVVDVVDVVGNMEAVAENAAKHTEGVGDKRVGEEGAMDLAYLVLLEVGYLSYLYCFWILIIHP